MVRCDMAADNSRAGVIAAANGGCRFLLQYLVEAKVTPEHDATMCNEKVYIRSTT